MSLKITGWDLQRSHTVVGLESTHCQPVIFVVICLSSVAVNTRGTNVLLAAPVALCRAGWAAYLRMALDTQRPGPWLSVFTLP